MKRNIIVGILVSIFGLLVAIGPYTLFPVCEPGEKIMKCFWTARMELGLGIVMLILGILLAVSRSEQFRLGISLSLLLNAILSLLVPTALIGVCGGAHMVCRTAALPALTILNALITALALYTVVASWLSIQKMVKPDNN